MSKSFTLNYHTAKRKLISDFLLWRNTVTTKNRFDINNPFLNMLDKNVDLYKVYINHDDTLYRGRIFNINELVDNDRQMNSFLNYQGPFQGYSAIGSGAPPAGKTTEGRLNCKGIPYLYTSDSIKTAVYELRPICREIISVAECIPKNKLLFADCTQYSSKSVQDYDLQLSWLLREISLEFSRPHYAWRNYWFTQYLAGHFYNMGFDGVVFESSLNKNGKNYVFFHPEDCEIISSTLIKVDNIDITYKPTDRNSEFSDY